MSNNAHELSNRLLNALDNNYNVIDMQAVNEIISILEKINITKELLETTRLGKHVNELRRKATDPNLARRAKILVKRWRDLIIPMVASPAHHGSIDRQDRTIRRLAGTPHTSPLLSRPGISPAVPSPRQSSRPAWGGYESDSLDVIVVDDDPPAPQPPLPPSGSVPAYLPLTPPVRRPPSPVRSADDKKAKRDKKLKKRRGHSRAGSGSEASAAQGGASPLVPPAPIVPPAPTVLPSPASTPSSASVWGNRNGVGHKKRRRNGTLDPYTALVNRIPKSGDKKVKTTKELLEQIQSRGTKPSKSPASPASPHSPDVILIEPDPCPLVESPLCNGAAEIDVKPVQPLPPLEDEREYKDCTCGEDIKKDDCPAARRLHTLPLHVHALHNAYLPGINGTRAPTHPHQFAVRKLMNPENPDLFTSVVPLYNYSDYADDYCVKNMSKVPLCTHLPWTEFAPPPPDLSPLPSPPTPRPYPIEFTEAEPNEDQNSDDSKDVDMETASQDNINTESHRSGDITDSPCPKVEPEMISVPVLEPSERLKAPLLSSEDEKQFKKKKNTTNTETKMEVEDEFKSELLEHRTVEKTKETEIDGRGVYSLCERVIKSVPYDYTQVFSAPVVTLPEDEVEATDALHSALGQAETNTERDEFDRPPRPSGFTEWHECARLGDLIALPYVVID